MSVALHPRAIAVDVPPIVVRVPLVPVNILAVTPLVPTVLVNITCVFSEIFFVARKISAVLFDFSAVGGKIRCGLAILVHLGVILFDSLLVRTNFLPVLVFFLIIFFEIGIITF